MSLHAARVEWSLRPGEDFAGRRYSRAHTLRFEGGASVAGSASTAVVPPPWSDPAGVGPEAAFTASLSACHMLWFLDLAAREGLTVERYADAAEGTLAPDAAGRLVMTRVALRPEVRFRGGDPAPAALADLHRRAHAACFLANSVKAEVVVEPVPLRSSPSGLSRGSAAPSLDLSKTSHDDEAEPRTLGTRPRVTTEETDRETTHG